MSNDLVSMLREPTKQQYYGFFAAWSGWVLDAFDFTVFFIAMPYIAKEFGVQHVATTGSIALTLLARLVGGWLAGLAADKWGRKLPLLISVVWFALCDGAVAFAPTFGTVLILRTLFGVGMGAEWTSGTTMAMESWPKRSRGVASGVLQGSWALGYILAALVSYWVLPRWGWRAMFAVAALPALLAIPMRWWVKEDPEVEARLAHEKYAFPLKRAFKEDPSMLKKVMWGSAIMAVGFGAYYAITGSYNPMLKEEMGASTGRIALLIIVFNIGMLIGSVGVGYLATKKGATAAITIPAALSLLVLPLYVGLGIADSSSGLLALGAFLGGAIGCGFCGATPLVLTSLFPTEVRARLVGLVYHIGACFAAFVPMATVALAKALHIKLSLSICLVAGVLELAVVVLVLAPAVTAKMVRRTTAAGGVAAATLLGVYVMGSASTGCLVSNVVQGGDGGAAQQSADTPSGAVTVEGDDPSKNPDNVDHIPYRALDGHPGCSTAGLDTRKALAYAPANIPGYKCAAKAYPMPKGDDPKKPIILLVHGNSSTPADYEKFPADTGIPQLADRMSDAGYRVLAVDFRYDLTDDPTGNNDTENAGRNFDHGWAVPILEHFIDSVMKAWPEQQVSIVGFSVAPTVIRDALRRMHRANKKPYERIDNLVLLSGSHHGVSTYRKLCGPNPTMRGRIACELGDRTAYEPTEFHKPLNGPNGDWETPCLDGETAYGQKGVCGTRGHKVKYTTIVMKDVKEGTYQDEFVSEGSSKLKGARNLTVELTDNDQSGYFYNGLFKNHYGALRSEAALKILVATLTGEQTN